MEMYGWHSIEEAQVTYANNVINYQLCGGFRVAVPIILDKKQAAKARQMAYKWLRENCPERFPKGCSWR